MKEREAIYLKRVQEFKLILIKMLTGLEKRVDELRWDLNKEIENIKTRLEEYNNK